MPPSFVSWCVFVSLGLTQIEIDFDVQRNIHRHAVACTRAEAPLLESLNRVLIQTEAEAAHAALNIDGSVTTNDRFEHHRSLITRFARFFGVLWLDTRQD